MSESLPIQAGILAALPAHARFIELDRHAGVDPQTARAALRAVARLADGDRTVLGIGAGLAAGLQLPVPGLHAFPALAAGDLAVPSTQADLWLWLRGDDRGELHHRARALLRAAAPGFAPARTVDGFNHAGGRDLSGYEDGTENPVGDAALAAAFVADGALAGSAFVSVQQWRHAFTALDAMTREQQDDVIGRDRDSNDELATAPASAHVRRTAQEDFDPPAFVVRRSMPWTDGAAAGLVFVAFGASLARFEALLGRMLGSDDGIQDGLFRFTRPLTGSHFWCPPVRGGRVDPFVDPVTGGR